jgi:hypothetical protein
VPDKYIFPSEKRASLPLSIDIALPQRGGPDHTNLVLVKVKSSISRISTCSLSKMLMEENVNFRMNI